MTASEKASKPLLPLAHFLKTTWELYRSHVSLFLGYSAWMLIPMILEVLLAITFGSQYTDITQPILLIIDLLITAWVVICLIQLSDLANRKRRIDTQELSSKAWHITVPFLLLGLLLGLSTTIGLVLLIIPGVLFSLYATFSSQIFVLEGLGIIASIKRSFALVRNRFWMITHRVLLGTVIILIPYFLAICIIIGLLLIVHQGNVDLLMSDSATLMETVFGRVVDVVFLPIFLIYSVLVYQNAKATQS